MSTVFASVVGALVSVLSAAPAVSEHVVRSRVRTIPAQWQDCVVVRPMQAELDQGIGQSVANIWVTTVQVECYAMTHADTGPDLVVDQLLQAVHNRLMQDRSLGGLVGNLQLLAINYDFDSDGKNTACATLSFSISHASAAGSITHP
ncbi:hypothetical protein MCEMIEM13_01526 [Comamonadaceae bacterium]